MNIMLEDLVKLFEFETEMFKIFDCYDNILFSGNKKNLLKWLSNNELFAVRKILLLYTADNIVHITIE